MKLRWRGVERQFRTLARPEIPGAPVRFFRVLPEQDDELPGIFPEADVEVAQFAERSKHVHKNTIFEDVKKVVSNGCHFINSVSFGAPQGAPASRRVDLASLKTVDLGHSEFIGDVFPKTTLARMVRLKLPKVALVVGMTLPL